MANRKYRVEIVAQPEDWLGGIQCVCVGCLHSCPTLPTVGLGVAKAPHEGLLLIICRCNIPPKFVFSWEPNSESKGFHSCLANSKGQ